MTYVNKAKYKTSETTVELLLTRSGDIIILNYIISKVFTQKTL